MDDDWTARLDQASAGLRDLAAMLWSYYTHLLKEGFTDEQAFSLTADYQMHVLEEG